MQRFNQHWSQRHEHTLSKWQSHDDKSRKTSGFWFKARETQSRWAQPAGQSDARFIRWQKLKVWCVFQRIPSWWWKVWWWNQSKGPKTKTGKQRQKQNNSVEGKSDKITDECQRSRVDGNRTNIQHVHKRSVCSLVSTFYLLLLSVRV